MITSQTPNKTFHFGNATVVFTNDVSQATGRRMPKLSVQVIDQYRYQREWTCSLKHEPGDSKDLYWESHVYMHPGRRETCKLSQAVAVKLMSRFLDLCEEHSALLFNKEGDSLLNPHRPRHEGFVQFCEQMHRGLVPSVKML